MYCSEELKKQIMVLFKSQIESLINLKKELYILRDTLVFSIIYSSLISISSVFSLMSPLSIVKITEVYSPQIVLTREIVNQPH